MTIVDMGPKSGPSSEATEDLVSVIRDKDEQVTAGTGINVYVTDDVAHLEPTRPELIASSSGRR